jgi:hypothetical protein
MQHSSGVATRREGERTVRCKWGVRHEWSNLRGREGGRLLALREPVHDLIENIRTTEKRLAMGVFGGIQQALLNTMGSKVPDNTLQRNWVRSPMEIGEALTNIRVDNEIFSTKNKHRLRWVSSV